MDWDSYPGEAATVVALTLIFLIAVMCLGCEGAVCRANNGILAVYWVVLAAMLVALITGLRNDGPRGRH